MQRRTKAKTRQRSRGFGASRLPDLFGRICAFLNLCDAARQALRSRPSEEARVFNASLEQNVLSLRSELLEKTYRPAPERASSVRTAKRGAFPGECYRDRIVHIALHNVLESVFDPAFVVTCFAYRRGKGSRTALDWFVREAGLFQFCLRVDVEDYAASIDHELLMQRIRRTIKCEDTLWLTELILESANTLDVAERDCQGEEPLSSTGRRCGLKADALTSRLWTNVYLNGMDHVMARAYGGERYGRYVHEIALFSDEIQELEGARVRLTELLAALRLRMDGTKTGIIDIRQA